MGLPGIAEMNVNIDKTGGNNEPLCFNDCGIGFLRFAQFTHEYAIECIDVADCVTFICRVDHATTFNPKCVTHRMLCFV